MRKQIRIKISYMYARTHIQIVRVCYLVLGDRADMRSISSNFQKAIYPP